MYAAVINASRSHSKGSSKPGDPQIRGVVGNNPGSLNGLQIWLAITRPDPQLERAIDAGLEEKDRIVRAASRSVSVGNLPAREFRHFSNDAVIESVLRCTLRHVTQDFNLTGEPRIAAPLDVTGDKAMKPREDEHGSTGKGNGCPQRDAPGGAAHDGINGL